MRVAARIASLPLLLVSGNRVKASTPPSAFVGSVLCREQTRQLDKANVVPSQSAVALPEPTMKKLILRAKVDQEDEAIKDEEKTTDGVLRLLSVAATAATVVAVALHGEAWKSFFTSLAEMKANSTPEEFSSAMSFWTFAAVSHPLLQPIFWISEVLHGSPGPKIAGLVPVTFILGNAVAIYVVSNFDQARKALSIAALASFLAYVGAGLDGKAGLGDYNIQLDDPYMGRVVKGCPSYDQVRLPSVDGFTMEKYKGRWYWQKVHDWTQFKEVYDSTVDIELTNGGKGYTDRLGIRGPSPKTSPLSWDKSPLANGAYYMWSGLVDETAPPGVMHESAFGVEFPNYIVDIQTDEATGEYKELIQFQCIECGGVRLYEGINFMSRSPEMSDSDLASMHARAEKAGLYPYGASPDQMMRIERFESGGEVENAWQAMWKSLGVQKLLERVYESFLADADAVSSSR